MVRMVRATCVLVLGVVVAASCLAAERKAGKKKGAEKPRKPAYTDPADAGPDFAFQGEYVGMVKTDEGEVKYGAQIIALGEGKYRAVGYRGGLPGDGWNPGSETVSAEGELKQGAVLFRLLDGDRTALVQDDQILVKEGDQTIATLSKVHRKSPTLGAKPPAGAVVLFDGTTAEHFLNGRMTSDGLLMEGVTSKPKFHSFTIHLEFRLPFQPLDRGQGRGNSGFYAQGRYEVQILDSFGLEGLDNECGGIYQVARPKLNMCFPPLAWQTYDIDFTAAKFEQGKKVANARMTVRHNGVVIHENVEIPHTTPGAILKDETPEPGPVYLQDHGNPVRFRNIWVVEKQ